ncbi:MAG: zinc ribbon domain-containing protein [Lentisphaerae bacterium]|nr:zinc ribbon domain-containing protein [Lentisphaerota bacterium]
MKCKSCGSELPENSLTCEYCGSVFKEEVDPSTAPQQINVTYSIQDDTVRSGSEDAQVVAVKGGDLDFLKKNQAEREEQPGNGCWIALLIGVVVIVATIWIIAKNL